MADTTFVEFTTAIEAPWLNDVNDHVYNNTATVHDAVSVASVPSGVITANNVQAALDELSSSILNLDSVYLAVDGSNVMNDDFTLYRDNDFLTGAPQPNFSAGMWLGIPEFGVGANAGNRTGYFGVHTADKTTWATNPTAAAAAGQMVMGYEERSYGTEKSGVFAVLGATDSPTGWAGMNAKPTEVNFRTTLVGNTRIVRTNASQHFLETAFQFVGAVPHQYRHRLTSTGAIQADGALTSPASDYAEMFEWLDGNPTDENRTGISVVLDGGKIRPATGGDNVDDIIGVISAKPTVLGDEYWQHWQGRFVRDDFNQTTMEDYDELLVEVDEVSKVTGTMQRVRYLIPEDQASATFPDSNMSIISRETKQREVTNPDWDPELEYTPRNERKEWDAVGLLGKLRVKVGQPIGSRWLKLRDISDDVEEWLIR